MNNKKLTSLILYSLAIIVCVIAWGSCLSPLNTQCFTNGEWGDYKFHYQGWISYLHGDSFVPPYILSFTWPYKSSIMFTDSIPLAAIVLKPLTRLMRLPDWQYFSTLSILNSILIAHLSLKIGAFRKQKPFTTLVLGSILLTSSISWSRLAVGHEALQYHSLILLPTYWAIAKKTGFVRWALLIFVSVGIHAYYTPMILALCLATANNKKYLATRLIFFPLLCIVSAYLYGFLPSAASSGTEVWGANLLSLIDPQDHSAIFNPLRKREPFEIEGYSYLGIGIMLGSVLLLSSHQAIKQNTEGDPLFSKNWWLVVLLLYAFALGHTWNIADTPVTPYKTIFGIPGAQYLYDIFRSSGRFTWPLYYTISIYCIDALDSFNRSRIILSLVLILQLFDSNLRVIFRQGSHYTGLSKHISPAQEWIKANPSMAANLRSASNLIINDFPRDETLLPPSYTPQYLNPKIFSNWGGDGITRNPKIPVAANQYIINHLGVDCAKPPDLSPGPTIVMSQNHASLQKLKKLLRVCRLNYDNLSEYSIRF